MRARPLAPVLALALAAASGASPAVAQTVTGALAGTVTSAVDGSPLADVCVEVYGEQELRTARTAADGTYRVSGLSPGQVVVAFNVCAEPRAGFAGEFFEDAPSWEQADPVDVRAGATATDVDAALETAARLSGTVTDDDTGQGVPGVCVVAFDDQLGMHGQTVSGADGRYALESLRGGTYQLVFQDCSEPFTYVAEGYDDVPLDQLGQGAEPTPVTVADGQARDGLDVGLEQGGALRGTVLGSHHGQPVSGVCVALYPAGGDRSEPAAVSFSGFLPTPTGEQAPGEYVFGGVRAGSYEVVANPTEVCGDDGYAPTAQGVGTVEVVKGSGTQVPDLVVVPQPSISAVCFGDPGAGQAPPPFSDVRNLHAPAIECLAALGIATGRGDGTYGPEQLVTRAQMASFLARTLTVAGVALPDAPPDAFVDDEGSVHERAIDQLAALGVVGGKGDGRYGPLEPVSRAQTATLLVNAYERATGYRLLAAQDAFSDDEASVHESAIDRAAAAGLAAGDGGRFAPALDVRRDQMATFVARTLDRTQRDRPEAFGSPFPAPAQPPPAPEEAQPQRAAASPWLRTWAG